MSAAAVPSTPEDHPDDAREEMVAYYANRPLMYRNVTLISICNVGWAVVDRILMPLVALRLLELGFRENWQGTIASVNGYALAFFVMYFGWKSDHSTSRMGRRKPYLFLSAPFIIASIALFPVFDHAHYLWVLVGLYILKLFFMDIKSSTFPLLNIDCVPRDLLARAQSVLNIANGLVGFAAMRYASAIIAVGEWFPYALGAVIMTVTTICAWWIKEPPIRYPATKPFRPWSTFQVVSHDKRIFLLMAGVAMINGFMVMNTVWLWFWAKEALGLERGEIFSALSWAALLNVALAFPVGWVIDRFGGLRVVILLWLGQFACFLWLLNVHDKSGLIVLSLATTVIAPLYAGADIMVYKSAPKRDVGSYTSTNSCIRNAFNASLVGLSGWIIYKFSSNFVIGFGLGIVFSTLGLVAFLVYARWMRPPASVADSPVTPALDGSKKDLIQPA